MKRENQRRKNILGSIVLIIACSGRKNLVLLNASAFAPHPGTNCVGRNAPRTCARQMAHEQCRVPKIGCHAGRKRVRSSAVLNMSKSGDPRQLSQIDRVRLPVKDLFSRTNFMQKDQLFEKEDDSLVQNAVNSIDDEASKKRRSVEMATMSAISITLAIGVVYALASSTDVEPNEMKNALGREGGNVERLTIATRNIVGVALPQSADDVIAVSIGEGIAGAIGAVATWLVGSILKFRVDDDNNLIAKATVTPEGMSENEVNLLITETLADGDYFLTRAAVLPLFEAAGVPSFVASLASVLVATLPYEAIKLTQQKRRDLEKDAILMDMLLKEEESRIQQGGINIVDKLSNNVLGFIQRLDVRTYNDDLVDEDASTILKNLPQKPADTAVVEKEESNAPIVDYVELFADITKWLEYDVLINNYRGILEFNGQGLSSGVESAIFGLLAALSSQLYTDVLYIYSDFGNPIKREKTLSRTFEGWTSLYATKCVSSATLFGVYEASRAPTGRLMSQLVSGGVEGCTGSRDFDLCMETYLVDNPPTASFQAELRAFVVSSMNWVDNLTDFIPLNDQESFESFARGAIVSLYSLLERFFSFFSF